MKARNVIISLVFVLALLVFIIIKIRNEPKKKLVLNTDMATRGYVYLYQQHVEQAHLGADLDFLNLFHLLAGHIQRMADVSAGIGFVPRLLFDARDVIFVKPFQQRQPEAIGQKAEQDEAAHPKHVLHQLPPALVIMAWP